jgi:arylamine N-acetyltransferase
MKNNLFNKYLQILEVEVSATTINLLEKIVKAHLIKIPFENISKLIYKKEGMFNIPDLSTFLNGVEKYNFGGTCYSTNYYLYLLLKHLGYEIKLCGADMKNPDVHVVSIVNIEGREFIVDVGYAAPFFKPLPRDLNEDHIIELGDERYVLKPRDENNYSKMEQYINGELKHWYTAKPYPKKIDDFQNVIADSYSDDATFMNALRISRFKDKGFLALSNLQLTETNGRASSSIEISFKDIPDVVREKFGMPADIVREAISQLTELKDVYE